MSKENSNQPTQPPTLTQSPLPEATPINNEPIVLPTPNDTGTFSKGVKPSSLD
jgi:hypothetical protein